MWEIKGKDNQVKATVGSLEYNGEWMGESYVTVTVESPAPVNFEIGDYIIYRDERFEINYDPGKIKSAPRYEKGDAFKYENIKFNSLADELTRCDFRDVVLQDNNLHFTSLPKFPFYGGVKDLANRIQANLDKLYTGANKWSVVVSPEFQGGKELNVQVDNIKVQGALEILVNQFETYYTITGRTITIGAAGIPAGHLFKYGKGNGLYEIEQNAEADQAIVTRLRAYGSTRNLPHRYYNSLSGADGKKLIPDNMAVQNLMLPEFPYTTQDPYIDSPNIAKLGIREGTVFFDGSGELEEIYPSIEGMTAEQLKAAGVPCNSTGALDEIVSAEQMTDNGVGEINEGETQTTAKPPTFKVTLKDLGFDINDHLTTETATLSFKTGMLGGRDFEIVGCKKIESGGKVTGYELELNRVYDDSIKLWFPYSAYNAQAGDKFVLLYIEMPEVYIKAAAQRLKEAATEWLSKNDCSRSIYAPKVDEIFMARQHDLAMASGGKIKSLHDTLKEGMLLLFEDEDLNIDASIFIDRLTIKEGDSPTPTYEVVLKEEKTVGRLDKMQNQIDSLAAGKGQGGGGYTAAQIRSMIDAYGSTRFLSKLKDDRSKGQIATDKALEVGDFLAGVSGAKIGIDPETGQTFGEMDRLFIRIKAYFETLTIINADSLAGEQRITPGGGVKCTSVEELDDVYRCYFLSEQDGEKTETKIIAGDQAIAQMFNAKAGTSNKVSNHRYWRLVTAVSNDAYTDDSGNRYSYIDLSKTDCEKGSDIPQAGDTIVQFGNRTDRTRQAAMVFSTVDADAPSIKLFTGIDSYSLAGKDIISYGYDPVKGNAYFNCYGDTYVGDPDGSTFIRYDRATKQLDIKAKLSVNTTFGGQTFEQWLTAHGYTDDTVANEALDAANDALDAANATKSEIDKYKYLANALQQDTQISGGLMMTTLISLGYTDDGNMRHTLAGMNGSCIPELGGRTIASWYGGEMIDLFDIYDNRITPAPPSAATSLIRMDGSAYWANGNIGFRADGSGWLGNDTNGIKFGTDGSMTFGNGIKISLSDGSDSGLSESLETVLNFTMGISDLFFPIDKNGKKLSWTDTTNAVALKAIRPIVSTGDVVAYVSGDTSSSTPTTALSELKDVNLGVLSKGDILSWDGRKWVNVPASAGGGGLDETQLANYLTMHNYLKADGTASQYLMADGSVREQVYFCQDLGNIPIEYINLSDYSAGAAGYANYQSGVYTVPLSGHSAIFVNFAKNHSSTSALQLFSDYYDDAPLMFRKTIDGRRVGGPWRTLVTELNIGYYMAANASQLDERFVNKAGDTMSGVLTLPYSGLVVNSAGGDTAPRVLKAYGGGYKNLHYINFGNAPSNGNAGEIMYEFVGAGSAENNVGLGLYGGKYVSLTWGGDLRIGGDGSWKKVWNENNDGSGSGLDADLLDGLHCTDFARSRGDMWNNGESVADWAKRVVPLPGIHSMDMGAWAYSASLTLGGYTIDRMRYSAIDFRRGNLNSAWNQKAVLFLPTYTDSSMMYIAQMSTQDTGGAVTTSVKRYADYDTIINGNVATATRLLTERIIFGNSFDGSADITGPRVRVDGTTEIGSMPNIMFHIPGVRDTQILMDGNGNLHMRDGSSQGSSYKNLFGGWYYSNGDTGWYNSTFEGGIYMDSAYWVKLYQKPLYIGTFRDIGCNTFQVGLKLENTSNISFEVQGGNYVMGMGCHSNGSWYWWRGTNGETVGNKSFVMQYDGSTWNFTGNILASGEVTAYSDIRLKSDIRLVEPKGRLRPVSYNKQGGLRRQMGLIAQEVLLLCPEAVHDSGEYLSLNYAAALVYGLAGVYNEIDSLDRRLKQLEAKI